MTDWAQSSLPKSPVITEKKYIDLSVYTILTVVQNKKVLSGSETLWNSWKMESRQAWLDRGAHSPKYTGRTSLCKMRLVPGMLQAQRQQDHRIPRAAGGPVQSWEWAIETLHSEQPGWPIPDQLPPTPPLLMLSSWQQGSLPISRSNEWTYLGLRVRDMPWGI